MLGDLEHFRRNDAADQTLCFAGRMSRLLKALICLARGWWIAITNLVVNHLKKQGPQSIRSFVHISKSLKLQRKKLSHAPQNR